MTKERENGGGKVTWPDVGMALIDRVSNLITDGYLIGPISLVFLAMAFYMAYKLKEEHLFLVLSRILEILLSTWFLLIPLVFSLLFCILTHIKNRKMYKREIQRLVDLRKELIHGFHDGTLSQLGKHTSAGYDLLEED